MSWDKSVEKLAGGVCELLSVAWSGLSLLCGDMSVCAGAVSWSDFACFAWIFSMLLSIAACSVRCELGDTS